MHRPFFTKVFFKNIATPCGLTARLQPQESSPTFDKQASWNNSDEDWKNANTILRDVFTAVAFVVS